MSHRFSEWAGAAAAVAAVAWLTSGPAAGQAPQPQAGCPLPEYALFHSCALEKAKTFNPPRTVDGKPDLQGYWRAPGSGTENIEEHPKTSDDAGGASMVVDPSDRKIPYQPWGRQQAQENRDKYVEPNTACFPSGVPRVFHTPTRFEILQTPGHVVILVERAHVYRIIPTDPRPHVGQDIDLWLGDSRGRWEGNTLVVDVTSQNGKPWFDQRANFSSRTVHMVERFTLIEADTIHYAVTIEDPNVYTRPWTMVYPMRRLRPFELPEEACHENEYNTDGLIKLGYRIYPGARPPSAR